MVLIKCQEGSDRPWRSMELQSSKGNRGPALSFFEITKAVMTGAHGLVDSPSSVKRRILF